VSSQPDSYSKEKILAFEIPREERERVGKI
jgi:hypothetical protein